MIHTIALFEADIATESGIKAIASADPKQQSSGVRTFLLERLKALYPAAQISIGKDTAGIPFIAIDDAVIPVSLSHHDRWVGHTF